MPVVWLHLQLNDEAASKHWLSVKLEVPWSCCPLSKQPLPKSSTLPEYRLCELAIPSFQSPPLTTMLLVALIRLEPCAEESVTQPQSRNTSHAKPVPTDWVIGRAGWNS